MALFTFHINIMVLHLQPIRFPQTSQHKYSTHGYQEGFFSLMEESLSIFIKTSNVQHQSVVSTPIHVLLYSLVL